MIVKLIKSLVDDQRGGTAIEYGLIAALVVITMITALMEVADTTTDLWRNVNTKVTAASGGAGGH